MPDAGPVDVISKLHEVDPVFREVVDMLFGDAIDPREAYDVSKMNDGSEMHVRGGLKLAKACRKCKGRCDCEKKVAKRELSGAALQARREKRQAQVGLASNVVGIAAGSAGLAAAARDERFKDGGKVAQKIYRAGAKIPKPISSKSGKAGAALAGGALGLQAANLAGDAVANRVLARESKKQVKKALEDIVAARRAGQISTETAVELADQLVAKAGKHRMSRKRLVARAELAEDAARRAPKATKTALGATAAVAAGTGYAVGRHAGKKAVERKVPLPTTGPAPVGRHRSDVNKAEDQVDYAFTGEISKMDEDKRLAFGWASLSTVDGEPVVDLQGDYAPIEEIEKSAYAYVIDSRVGGDMHTRDGEKPKHTSDLVESFIATPDKLEQMGVPGEVAKSVPVGWWVGFKVNDDEQWAMVKDGRRAGFSIHGKGSRVKKALDAA